SSASHFAKLDDDLLKTVATHITHYWVNWLKRCEAAVERASWKNLLDGLAELDRLSIDSSTPIGEEGDRQIFSIAIQTIAATVHQANLLDVRLLNKEGTELHLFETLGDAWPSDTKPLTKARKSSSDTADLNVQLEKTSVLTADSLEEGYRELFPEITSM